MAEIAVAFPLDEATAGVIVSRLAVDGIAARIDRGLYGAFLAPQQGQLRVMVDAAEAARARTILEGNGRRRRRGR